MKVYLVEKTLSNGILIYGCEPVKICKTLEEAKRVRDWELITEMELGKTYKEGVGICRHWHKDEILNAREGE